MTLEAIKMNENSDKTKGVEIRENSMRITFQYKGIQCRETISGIPVTKSNIKYAARKRASILLKIEKGTFNYLDEFPNSKMARKLGFITTKNQTVKHYLEQYLTNCVNRNLSPSTVNGYRKCITALSPFHPVQVKEVTPSMIKSFIQNSTVSLKTMRNNLSLLRSALDECITDGLISVNPCIGVNPAKYMRAQDKTNARGENLDIDPITPREEEAILMAANSEPQWKNLFQFWLHTGLRSSELIALKWADIDLINKQIMVVEAMVLGITKGTKTKSGKRLVDLDDAAYNAIVSQKQHTFLENEYVFHDPRTQKHWLSSDSIRKKAWAPVLKKAGVRYRRPYNCRHTFACRHISTNANYWWLANQMGHKSPEMLFKHYGSYMDEFNRSKRPFLEGK